MDGVICKMNDEFHTTEELVPIIHMEKLFSIEYDIEKEIAQTMNRKTNKTCRLRQDRHRVLKYLHENHRQNHDCRNRCTQRHKHHASKINNG